MRVALVLSVVQGGWSVPLPRARSAANVVLDARALRLHGAFSRLAWFAAVEFGFSVTVAWA